MVAVPRHMSPPPPRLPQRDPSGLIVRSMPSIAAVPTTFRATIDASSAFVVLRGESGDLQMCAQMDRRADDTWELTLRLRPGRYRYRYYAIHDSVTTYVSPADVDSKPVRMRGLDAMLVIQNGD